LSERYFGDRLRRFGCQPILMTQQLMYPGSFILHSTIEKWSGGGSRTDCRTAAALSYAKNQKISVKASTEIFADLDNLKAQQ
jgi:hypothetical protein